MQKDFQLIKSANFKSQFLKNHIFDYNPLRNLENGKTMKYLSHRRYFYSKRILEDTSALEELASTRGGGQSIVARM